MSVEIGVPIALLDTPVLLVDVDRLDGNIARWADFARDARVHLRPHAKTHKCVEIARRQLRAGASGLTVAKLGEAEVMADAGFTNLFLAYEVVGEAKVRRLLALSQRAQVRIGIDSINAALPLAEAAAEANLRLDALIEVDSGLGRCGVPPGEPLVDLARKLAPLRGLRVAGIFTYRGYRPDPEHAGHEEGQLMAREAERLRGAGVPVDEVSVGSTPTGKSAARVPGVTEVRPGTYVFNDATQVHWGVSSVEECALTVLSRVVSRPSRDIAILDAGSKTLTSERGPFSSKGDSHGVIRGFSDCQIDRLWEEHARVQLTEEARQLRVGDLVEIIPTHVCPTVNLATELVCVRGGRVAEVWPVAARARVR